MNVKDAVLTAACTFLIIIGAYISLPIGPMPIVLTNFFIVLVGLLIGKKRALIVIISYIVIGAIGLPVFSNGKGGLTHLMGLTGGFIFAFIPLAFLSGLVSKKGIIIKLIITITASIIVYVIGIPWAQWVYNNIVAPAGDKPPWDLNTTLKYCAIPFLIPDLIKVIAAVLLSKLLTPVLKPFLGKRDE